MASLAGASLGRAGGAQSDGAGRVLAAGTPQRRLGLRRAGGAPASTVRRSARRLRRAGGDRDYHPHVQDTDLEGVAGELYALSPGDFTAAREERAAQARAAGDRDLARAIGALRRPVVSAWLVNQLAREAGDQVADLVALGEALRQAQQDLDGDRVRELSVQRRRLVAALLAEAKRLAARDGRPAGLQVEREVEATLQAALADAGAAAEVRAGRLAGPLSYAGLGVGEEGSMTIGGRRAATRDAPAGDKSSTRAAAARKPARQEQAGPKRPRLTAEEREAQRAAAAAERAAQRAAAEAERRANQIADAQRAVAQAAETVADATTALNQAEQQVTTARTAQESARQ
jgi:hypothetical protein